ncbi:hypothetical protein ACLKA6_017275 [Drosophila palustris]
MSEKLAVKSQQLVQLVSKAWALGSGPELDKEQSVVQPTAMAMAMATPMAPLTAMCQVWSGNLWLTLDVEMDVDVGLGDERVRIFTLK